jgi:hypothetical protein
MEDLKEFIYSCSVGLFEHTHLGAVVSAFIAIFVAQIGNWIPIHFFAVYTVASDVMDVIWWIDFPFTIVAVVNWVYRKRHYPF